MQEELDEPKKVRLYIAPGAKINFENWKMELTYNLEIRNGILKKTIKTVDYCNCIQGQLIQKNSHNSIKFCEDF